jgi:hypothetical protein
MMTWATTPATLTGHLPLFRIVILFLLLETMMQILILVSCLEFMISRYMLDDMSSFLL